MYRVLAAKNERAAEFMSRAGMLARFPATYAPSGIISFELGVRFIEWGWTYYRNSEEREYLHRIQMSASRAG